MTEETRLLTLLPAPIATNCRELSISDFIDIICEERETPEKWTEIFDEYLFLTRGNANNALLELKKQAVMFQNMFNLINIMIEMVALDQSLPGYIELNDSLRKFTRIIAKGKIDQDELQRHMNVRTSYAEKLREKMAEITALETDGSTKESTRKDWSKQISMLAKYQGYRMDNVSVSDYCAALNNFKEDNKPKKGFKYNN